MFGKLWNRQTRQAAAAVPATTLPLDRLIGMRRSVGLDQRRSMRGLTHLPGDTRTKQRGQGLEFDDLRRYEQGDDIRHIDWNVTARTGEFHTRLYREERQRACTIAVDFRASMFTGSQRLRAVVAGELAAALVWRAVAGGDRTSAFVFDDRRLAVTRPMIGESGALDAVGAVASGFAAGRTAERGSPRHLADILHRIGAAGRSFGAFVLITGFDDPGPDLEPQLMAAGRRGRLAVVVVEDEMEADGLPAGRYAFRSNSGSGTVVLSEADRLRLKADLQRQARSLREMLDRCGVPFVEATSAGRPSDVAGKLIGMGAI